MPGSGRRGVRGAGTGHARAGGRQAEGAGVHQIAHGDDPGRLAAVPRANVLHQQRQVALLQLVAPDVVGLIAVVHDHHVGLIERRRDAGVLLELRLLVHAAEEANALARAAQAARLGVVRRRGGRGTPMPTNDSGLAELVRQQNLALDARDKTFDQLPQLVRV